MDPNLIPIKDAVTIWNQQYGCKYGELLMSNCHRNKEKSFSVYDATGRDVKDSYGNELPEFEKKYLDVGFVKIKNKYYVDKNKLQQGISDALFRKNKIK